MIVEILAVSGVLLSLVASIIPRFRARWQLAMLGFFVSGVSSTFLIAPAVSAWAVAKLEVPLWIVAHWGDIEAAARSKIIIIAVGSVILVLIFARLFYACVYRMLFPDLVRVDARGHATRFGRVYWRSKLSDGTHRLLWRYDGHWTPPWAMETLITEAAPEPIGLGLRLGVPASRFELASPHTWRAIPLGGPDADIPTTPVRIADFREWRENDLELKEEIAKKGAQGHLFTQRERVLKSTMDETFMYTGTLAERRGERRTVPVEPVMPSAMPVEEDEEDTPIVTVKHDAKNNGGRD